VTFLVVCGAGAVDRALAVAGVRQRLEMVTGR
jgi:hypothetical protein